MDKFAKRAAIAAAVFVAASVIALGVGLLRATTKLEQDTGKTKTADAPKLGAALTLPEEPSPVAAPAPVPSPAPVAESKPDLATAFGNALGVEVKKTQPPSPAPGSNTPAPNAGSSSKPSKSSDTLDLGFAASSRDAKLNTRDAKPLDVRQAGGEKAQLKQEKPSERISFENDLGKAR